MAGDRLLRTSEVTSGGGVRAAYPVTRAPVLEVVLQVTALEGDFAHFRVGTADDELLKQFPEHE